MMERLSVIETWQATQVGFATNISDIRTNSFEIVMRA